MGQEMSFWNCLPVEEQGSAACDVGSEGTKLLSRFIGNLLDLSEPPVSSLIKFLLHRKFCSALCHETTLELLCQL